MAAGVKVTVGLDAEDVAKARAAMGGAEGEPDAAVIQRVLNGYLLKALLDDVNSRSGLSEDEATRIAVDEVRAYRRERDAAR
jgi:hypothetical protein